MIHGSNLGKEICCWEENKSFQASLSSRTCLSKETGHTGFIRCRSSSIHWTWQWTLFNALGTKDLPSRNQWNTSCSQYHPNSSRGLSTIIPANQSPCIFKSSSDGWERLKAGGETGNRGWDSWMVSPTQWTWVWETPGDSEEEGSLECCSPWGHKESDMT